MSNRNLSALALGLLIVAGSQAQPAPTGGRWETQIQPIAAGP